MGIWQIIGAFIQLVFLIMKRVSETDATKKAKLKEAEDAVKKGIDERDPSAVTSGFDLANRV